MRTPPPRNSRCGKVYAFTIGDLVADPPNRRTRRAWERDIAKIVKVGRTNNIVRRAREWRKQCPGQVQIWQWYYETRYAAKLEQLVHLDLKAMGAWTGAYVCDFCPVRHREKFYLEVIGGLEGLAQIIEKWLRFLGEPVMRKWIK
ncbi:hypothetical protein B0H10DRAFT_1956876 [Mycena sp. CBHHK59/15]|nr:hypothetical protein B0H10DRAFT_1956876 [Mycena sp. CBHHK59/15]